MDRDRQVQKVIGPILHLRVRKNDSWRDWPLSAAAQRADESSRRGWVCLYHQELQAFRSLTFSLSAFINIQEVHVPFKQSTASCTTLCPLRPQAQYVQVPKMSAPPVTKVALEHCFAMTCVSRTDPSPASRTLAGINKRSCECIWTDSAYLSGAEHRALSAAIAACRWKYHRFLSIPSPLHHGPRSSPARAHRKFGEFKVLAQTVSLCPLFPFYGKARTHYRQILQIVSAQPSTPGFKQTA